MPSLYQKMRREIFKRTWALGLFGGEENRYTPIPLYIVLSPVHSIITRIRPCSTIAAGNNLFRAKISEPQYRAAIYRVSQEECARLREGVPYAKIYRYNPKHLCPKWNFYADNGQRNLNLWQLLLAYWLPNTYWNWQEYVVSVMLIAVRNIKFTCEWHKAIKLKHSHSCHICP